MLILTETRIPNASVINYDILPSEIGLIEEGMALALVWSSGQSYVQRTTGNGTDQFIGVAFGPRRPLSAYGVWQDTFVINNASAATLTYTGVRAVAPVAGLQAPLVFSTNPTTGAITAFTPTASPTTAPAASGQVQIASLNPLTLIFDAADNGTTVTINFNYVPTIDDVQFNRGSTGYAYNSEQADNQDAATVGVITQTYEIVTDKFVATEDWYTNGGGNLHVTAGGYFATAAIASGTDISGIGLQPGRGFARVKQSPTSYGNGQTGLMISINM